ncbi:MAG: peptide MFS transporter [Candidatus Competibacteraceae bacterium]|nr:peptide MFS transporter [Candidatus Competibacteraceae bacterium]
MTETVTKKHPKGLYLLYFTEMWERFSYYGMRAIFTLYMINALLLDKSMASKIYGSYTGLVYLTPLLGGYIADRFWGNRKSIIFGGLLMAIGQFLMFFSGSLYHDIDTAKLVMYGGLGFLIFGNGFFKPNISTMVGQLYKPGDSRVDSAFTIFYQGINLGALMAPLVCGGLGEQYDVNGLIIPSQFKYGFLAAALGMLLSLGAFVWLKNKFIVTPEGDAVGLPPKQAYNRKDEQASPPAKTNPMKIVLALVGWLALFSGFYFGLKLDEIGAMIFSTCLVLPVMIISDKSLTAIERDRILVIYIIAFFVIFFWSAFEQAGASLTFFAQEQTDRNIFGWNMPASFFQIFNAMFIVILAPVAVSIWSFLAARSKEPSSPVKQSMGLGFLALGYLFIAWGVNGIQPWDKVSMVWLVGLYLIHTIGELCLSPIGLSMVVKLAPVRFVSLLMGVWFMSTATANKFAGDLSALYPEEVKIETVATASDDVIALLKDNVLGEDVWNSPVKNNIAITSVKAEFDKNIIKSMALANESDSISMYSLKLIKTANPSFEKALISDDGNFIFGYKQVEIKKGKEIIKEDRVEVWNLHPKKPSFLGMQINDLYDFFMIFVYMAGAAALILFIISKWLLKMMHGIR